MSTDERIGFSGFGSDVPRFFDELARDNSRAFFDANRDTYASAVRAPLEALLAEAEQRYGIGRVMRPNRDVRFSADKSPYRTDASLTAGSGPAAVYLRVSAEGIQAGGGCYEPSRDQLARARDRIDTRPAAADGLQRIIDTLHERGFSLAGPSLRTAPRAYPRDHPRIELLRLRHFAASTDLPLDAALDEVLGAWRTVEPLLDWVRRWVGPAESWP